MIALIKMSRPAQLALDLPSTWGGARRNAGRKPIPGRRRATPHRSRPDHKARHPVHVTLRARPGLPSLRSRPVFAAVSAALSAASTQSFRLVHFSVQSDHLHVIVEAHDKLAVERGVLGLIVRVARAINRVFRRSGRVWGDRYHTRAMQTPREVRHGLVYVLMNFKKHHAAGRQQVDFFSSAPWFDGFRNPMPQVLDPPPTRPPRTWLASVGWRRYGLIGFDEAPLPARRR
jgi:REP element-mobilizing transposase RayT